MFDLVVWAIVFSILGFWLARWWVDYRAKRVKGELRAWEAQWVDRVERVLGPVARLWQRVFMVRTLPTGAPIVNNPTMSTPPTGVGADHGHLTGETASAATAPVVITTDEATRVTLSARTTNATVARAHVDVEVPLGATVHFAVETLTTGEVNVRGHAPLATSQPTTRAWAAPKGAVPSLVAPAWLSKLASLEMALFVVAVAIYLFTRLWSLEQFPIYFFADEATQAILAEDLVARGWRGTDKTFLPVYFEAAGLRWTPVLPVYFHAVSVALFGKSIFVTRATSAIVSVLAALAVSLMLKWVFKARYWWVGALILAATPAWFLHSRTGFETVSMTALYAAFLLSYLLYRTRSPNYLYATLVFGAATFYTYSNAQIIIGAATFFLLISDAPYHWEQIRTQRGLLIGALVVTAIVAWPFISFRMRQPEALETHLRAVDSYWFKPVSTTEKLTQFATTYAYGLSPQYWFLPNEKDLARHRMKGYGNLRVEFLPFFFVGVIVCLWKLRSSPHRAVLLAALATPAGAALLDITITRTLAFVVPASILIALGIEWLLDRLKAVPYTVLAGGTVTALSAASLFMARDALDNGPLWYRDYGLYGMQYGARQLFEETIPQYLEAHPGTTVLLSPTWANGTDVFVRFFGNPKAPSPVQITNVDYYLFDQRSLTPNLLFIMTPEEMKRAIGSGKFKPFAPEYVLQYPDGTDGFYFAHLAYVDNIDQLFADERNARRQPVAGSVIIDGQEVQVTYSRFAAGQLSDLFDDDRFSLIRGEEANPLLMDFTFSQPRAITGLIADYGTIDDFTVRVALYAPEGGDPVMYEQTYQRLPNDPRVEMVFDRGPQMVARVYYEIKNNLAGDTAQTHIRGLKFTP